MIGAAGGWMARYLYHSRLSRGRKVHRAGVVPHVSVATRQQCGCLAQGGPPGRIHHRGIAEAGVEVGGDAHVVRPADDHKLRLPPP